MRGFWQVLRAAGGLTPVQALMTLKALDWDKLDANDPKATHTRVEALRLAWQDRKDEPKLVQGQLMGASEVSTSLGLGMLMVQTRGGVEQYLVPPARLKQVPGNQVNIVLTVTPHLKHVKSVGVMGQRMVGRVEPPVPPVMRRLQLLPLLTPLALAAAAVIGDDAVALAPIQPSAVHALIAVLTGAVLAGAVYGVSFLLQRRMMEEVQALVPRTSESKSLNLALDPRSRCRCRPSLS